MSAPDVDCLNGDPRAYTDEAGDVDLSLIEYCLSLTPAERLRRAEQFAQWVLAARQQQGIEWPSLGPNLEPNSTNS